MKKFISVLLLITFCLCTLTGCHGSKGMAEFEMPDGLNPDKTYEITFWAKNDTNKTQTDIYYKAIEDFEKLYPNVHVSIKLYTDYGRLYNDVITNISTNTTPNVCVTYPDHIATYMTGKNTVLNLDKIMDDPKYGLGGSELKFDGPTKDEIIPKFLEECKLYGSYYAIPYMRSTEALYINEDYVHQLGYDIPEIVTWDWLWEVADKAALQDENGLYLLNHSNVMIPIIYKSTDNMMISYLKQRNAGYTTDEGDILLFNDATKELLYDVRDRAERKSFSTFKISSYPGNFLNTGESVFGIDSTAGATWMGSHAPLSDLKNSEAIEFNTVVRAIPQVDPEHPQMISQGPSICVFNKDDNEEVLASWLFAQYMLNNDTQIAYSQTEGYIPVTSKAHNTAEYQDYLSRAGEDNNFYYNVKIEAAKLLLDHMDDTFITPVFNGSASVRDAAGYLIESTVKSVNRNQKVDEAFMTKLFSDTTSLYRLDQLFNATSTNAEDLGELPKESKALIVSLTVVWVLIIAYFGLVNIKRKK